MIYSVVGKIRALQRCPCPIPEICLYVTLQSKRDFADTIKDLKMGVIQVGPLISQGSF